MQRNFYMANVENIKKELENIKYPGFAKSIVEFGFVKDIQRYYAGTDCFICPVTLGAGVKTKLIDALAAGLPVIAFEKSTEGISNKYLNQQLICIPNNNWDSFAQSMMEIQVIEEGGTNVPAQFYKEYHWDHIVQESILSLPE